MEKIVNKIQSRKQSRKLGRYTMTNVYRIQPSSRQCDNAETVTNAGKKSSGKPGNRYGRLKLKLEIKRLRD